MEKTVKIKPFPGEGQCPSPFRSASRVFIANRHAVFCLGFIGLVTILCLLAPLLTPYDPDKINLHQLNQAPGSGHWLGTDKGGRDVAARLLYGGRTTLWISAAVSVIICTVGTMIGAVAGNCSGAADSLLMRLTDLVLAFPFLIIVIVVKSIYPEGGLSSLIWTAGLLGWGGSARMIRSKILAEKQNEYVLAARSLGAGPQRILVRHLLPNIMTAILVNLVLTFASAVALETSLSFLGFGVQAGAASWGNMMSDAASLEAIKEQWWVWLPAGLLITSVILSINLIGEAIKGAFQPQ